LRVPVLREFAQTLSSPGTIICQEEVQSPKLNGDCVWKLWSRGGGKVMSGCACLNTQSDPDGPVREVMSLLQRPTSNSNLVDLCAVNHRSLGGRVEEHKRAHPGLGMLWGPVGCGTGTEGYFTSAP